MPKPPATFNGGGGLYSTAADYTRFMQAILRKGEGILQPKTIQSMTVNQIGSANAGKMRSFKPDISADVDIQPGATEKWGLGFLINTTAYRNGRAAGSQRASQPSKKRLLSGESLAAVIFGSLSSS